MPECFLDTKPADSTPLIPVVEKDFQSWLERQDATLGRWLVNTGFLAKPDSLCLVPGTDGTVDAVIVGVTAMDRLWACGDLSKKLPAGHYHLITDWEAAAIEQATIGWGLVNFMPYPIEGFTNPSLLMTRTLSAFTPNTKFS